MRIIVVRILSAILGFLFIAVSLYLLVYSLSGDSKIYYVISIILGVDFLHYGFFGKTCILDRIYGNR